MFLNYATTSLCDKDFSNISFWAVWKEIVNINILKNSLWNTTWKRFTIIYWGGTLKTKQKKSTLREMI